MRFLFFVVLCSYVFMFGVLYCVSPLFNPASQPHRCHTNEDRVDRCVASGWSLDGRLCTCIVPGAAFRSQPSSERSALSWPMALYRQRLSIIFSRLVVLESGLGLESGLESIFAGLGLGLRLGSFFSKSFFKSTLQSAPVERVFSHGGIVNFAISHSSTVICCT